MAIALMTAGYTLGLVEPRALVQTALLSVLANLVFFLLIRTGWNLRLRDPSLTLAQIVTANLILMQAAYFAGPLRGLYLVMYLVVYVFGIFRLTTRQFVGLCVFSVALYAAMVVALLINRPETVTLRVEIFQGLVLASILPWFAAVGGQISALRQRLRATNRELEESLRRIEEIATRDELTGLGNRALFSQYVVHAISKAKRNRTRLAVMFLDLDRFKHVNDALGHDAGDEALRKVARRLRECLRESDHIARLGGDEFVILLENLPDDASLTTVAAKVLERCATPIFLREQEFTLSVSIGASIYPDDADDAGSLMKNADIAMYRAKEQGRNNVQFYSARMREEAEQRLSMESKLRRALEHEELVLHFQPKVDIGSGRLCGVEALVRWQNPETGLMGPDKFIPFAEETGLILPLGEWVLNAACRQAARWHLQGFPLAVAVNLSARQFRAKGLLPGIRAALDSSALPPSQLELELTESLVMQDAEQAARLLDELHGIGIGLSLDDFGTGYSSLSYLKRFPFDNVKIDRSFVRHLPDDPNDAAITRAVIAMSHSLQMRVIAEGVENEAQRGFLREAGCDQMQGYLVSKPVPAPQLEVLLQVRSETVDGAIFLLSRPA
jgi:diguanylate cyclase (GGDEF)-like protein